MYIKEGSDTSDDMPVYIDIEISKDFISDHNQSNMKHYEKIASHRLGRGSRCASFDPPMQRDHSLSKNVRIYSVSFSNENL